MAKHFEKLIFGGLHEKHAVQRGRPGMKLTTHLHLIPRTRKCGSIHPLPHTPSRRSS
jgi:hypothetical protein